MKIIAGEKKGYPLLTPEGQQTRPTLSRIREALFSIIAGDLPDAFFCDLYCGGGNIGLEALSRGASKAIFIEKDAAALRSLTANIQKLDYSKRAVICNGDVTNWKPIKGAEPDIVFADPPYTREYAAELTGFLERTAWKSNSLIILQLPAPLEHDIAGLEKVRSKKYGKTYLEFYVKR